MAMRRKGREDKSTAATGRSSSKDNDNDVHINNINIIHDDVKSVE